MKTKYKDIRKMERNELIRHQMKTEKLTLSNISKFTKIPEGDLNRIINGSPEKLDKPIGEKLQSYLNLYYTAKDISKEEVKSGDSKSSIAGGYNVLILLTLMGY